MAACDGFHVGQRHRLREARHSVVGGVHAQQRGRPRRDRLLVVGRTRAVGGADLDHARTRQSHDVRHPERAADLDQLAARYDHLAPLAKGGQREQDRGCVVVHDQRRLADEEPRQEPDKKVRALSPLPRHEVELDIAVTSGDRERLGRRSRERRAAEVGVQDHSARIDHALQTRRHAGVQPRRDAAAAFAIVKDLIAPLRRHLLANRLDNPDAAELFHHRRVRRLVDQPAYSRQG